MNNRVLNLANKISSWESNMDNYNDERLLGMTNAVLNRLPDIVSNNTELGFITDRLMDNANLAYNKGKVTLTARDKTIRYINSVRSFLLVNPSSDDYAIRGLIKVAKAYETYDFEFEDDFVINVFKILNFKELMSGTSLVLAYLSIIRNNNMRVLIEGKLGGMILDFILGNRVEAELARDTVNCCIRLGWCDKGDVLNYLYKCSELYNSNRVNKLIENPTIEQCLQFAIATHIKVKF